MNIKEKLGHLILIAQLRDRKPSPIVEKYQQALGSEEALAEVLEELDGEEHKVHEIKLLDVSDAMAYAFLILVRDLHVKDFTAQNIPEELLVAAAKVFIVGYYGKTRVLVSTELQSHQRLQAVYERGKRK